MPWFRIRVTFYDAVATKPLMSATQIEGDSLPQVMKRLGEVIMERWSATEDLPFSDLSSMMLVPVELTTWTSSRSCERPAPEVLHAHLRMRKSVVDFLSSTGGQPWVPTPEDSKGSSPK